MADDRYQLAGKVNVPAEKRDEINRQVLKIMDKCGIRKTAEMEAAGKKAIVVSPVYPDENGIVSFDYSIFEKKKRKISTYDINTCELHTEDRGYDEFGVVMNIIMVLQEAYTDGGCYLVKSGKLCDAEAYLYLLQGVLGERIRLPGRTRMWEMYLFFRNSEEYQDVTYLDLLYGYSREYGELDIEQMFVSLEAERGELIFPNNRRSFCRAEINSADSCCRAEYAYRIFCSMDEEEKGSIETFLMELLNSGFDKRKELSLRQDKKGILAELSLYEPSARLTLAYAQAIGKDFWETWDSFGGRGYSDILQEPRTEKKEKDLNILPFYRAIQRENEDEFLEFWDGHNLVLSQAMEKCIQGWKEQFDNIRIPSRFSAEHLLADVITRMENGYCRYLDQAFVTEFLEHGDNPNYRKALILFRQLLDAGQEYFPELTGSQADMWIIRRSRGRFDRTALSAFASLMVNKKQRNKIFGF